MIGQRVFQNAHSQSEIKKLLSLHLLVPARVKQQKRKEVIKMADSFHFSVNIISRGKGKSAVASAAYICGEKININGTE